MVKEFKVEWKSAIAWNARPLEIAKGYKPYAEEMTVETDTASNAIELVKDYLIVEQLGWLDNKGNVFSECMSSDEFLFYNYDFRVCELESESQQTGYFLSLQRQERLFNEESAKYVIRFLKNTDDELIKYIESVSGTKSTTQIFREALDYYIKYYKEPQYQY